MNLGAPELIFLAVWLLLVGIAPYVTWRHGGSKSRVAVALLVSLIPYGFIVGLVIAITTKRTDALASGATGREPPGASTGAVAAPINRHSGLERSILVAVVLVVAFGSALSGVIGYYIGQQNLQGPHPTWTDREIHATGTQNVGTLRCTYHMADGTVRVRESVITLSGYDPFAQGRAQDCPPAP